VPLTDPQNRISALSYGLPFLSPPLPGENLDIRESRQHMTFLYREDLLPRPVTLVRAVVLQADSRRAQFGD